jgi:hypothetical protein
MKEKIRVAEEAIDAYELARVRGNWSVLRRERHLDN